MRFVRVGRNHREIEIPETWAEAEKMLDYAYSTYSGRGGNLAIQATCTRVAYGLLCDQSLTPDPTEALLRLMQRICRRKGAGLER
jgi:hypothetical protein